MTTVKTYKRPYATHYFNRTDVSKADYVSGGCSCTEEGAIRAAVPRLFTGQYARAIIYDRGTGVAMYNVCIRKHGIMVQYGSGIHTTTPTTPTTP